MCWRQENQLTRTKMSLKVGNITNLYEIFDLKVPKKISVAMYLIK